MKSNDVTGRFSHGEVGIGIDIGRPGLGASMRDIDLFTRRLANAEVFFSDDNPVTFLLEDRTTGAIQKEVLDERVLSAVIEIKVPVEKLSGVLSLLKGLATETRTVFSVGLISRLKEDGSIPALRIAEEEGFPVQPSAKLNVGLGRRGS
ncbi:MAG: hypothetical protein AB1576_13280 [Bacillota bacterium]